MIFLCAAMCMAVAAPSVTRADDDPFQIETGHWMSFDHYKDADKRGIITPPALNNAPAIAEPAPAPEAAATAPAATASAVPPVAAPTRPLDLPPMPGLNKGFKMQVNSTEDDFGAPTPPPVIAANPAAAPDIHISDKNWQNPASIARYKKSVQNEDAEETPPIDVRMSYLPDSKVTPVPSPEHDSAMHQARVALEKSMSSSAKPKTAPAQDAAVCAAIDAYKKQQLDAIQSDRQTLKALQDAIASLGLQKQLSFMAGSDSALNAQSAQQTPAPTSIDIPASTSVR